MHFGVICKNLSFAPFRQFVQRHRRRHRHRHYQHHYRCRQQQAAPNVNSISWLHHIRHHQQQAKRKNNNNNKYNNNTNYYYTNNNHHHLQGFLLNCDCLPPPAFSVFCFIAVVVVSSRLLVVHYPFVIAVRRLHICIPISN